MSIEWKLRQVMAKNDIWSGSELLRRMEDMAGYSMSAASISALINEPPKMVRMETLDALCTALDCKPDDLLIHEQSYIGKIKESKKLSSSTQSKKVSNGRSLPPI
ncbi:helix-turn-helix transcriptional regulator [Enterococcus faecalis]|uniref:helix-turn-helix domain-containing protein n=1 Tax=Lactobacillales TaxID=186826 RepID=UPI0003539E14|nr:MULTISPECIES: helix-turn-helix transcriptional regulator [Lactobacillales]EIB6804458.1 helix-turn-helix transcriptional regulator [Enterococcus faecalis]EJR1589223.1 helix-turn-helix transcriptional regulator [Enterococcus faecalis]EKK5901924.1 helix-turn-helix transcriptional regulator [Enterococcus faecalis]EKZ0170639.1 helix-turn-helix transcriptional regulator [Enterococcus faecalis]EMD7416636.1 helix-turn-helix transcriptional regulator [Enterococcus faecalis]